MGKPQIQMKDGVLTIEYTGTFIWRLTGNGNTLAVSNTLFKLFFFCCFVLISLIKYIKCEWNERMTMTWFYLNPGFTVSQKPLKTINISVKLHRNVNDQKLWSKLLISTHIAPWYYTCAIVRSTNWITSQRFVRVSSLLHIWKLNTFQTANLVVEQ